MQGRCRVFKSGLAEEIIECRWHERGESTRGGLLSLGGLGDSIEKILNSSASMCIFMRLGPDFSHDFLLEKIFLGA